MDFRLHKNALSLRNNEREETFKKAEEEAKSDPDDAAEHVQERNL